MAANGLDSAPHGGAILASFIIRRTECLVSRCRKLNFPVRATLAKDEWAFLSCFPVTHDHGWGYLGGCRLGPHPGMRSDAVIMLVMIL